MTATPAITFASAKTVLQEITFALLWIGANQILKRRYQPYTTEPRFAPALFLE